jgi:deazaflavin-dependent oxidoreductase (nitroreductase family)
MPEIPDTSPDATAEAALRAQLDRVAAHEARVSAGPLTRLIRRLSTTAQFAAVYRRVGPVIDPRIQHIRDGRLMASLYGFPLLALTTTGAKSGEPRTSMLIYVRDGEDLMLVGTNFGQPKHPAWTANLLAHPEASVRIGGETVRVLAELVDDETWARMFPRFVAVYPGYGPYLERRGDLPPRMFRLRPGA